MSLVHQAGRSDDFDGERAVANAMALAALRSSNGRRVDVRDARGRIVAVYRSGRPVAHVRDVGPAR
jgi:hypothetical protein